MTEEIRSVQLTVTVDTNKRTLSRTVKVDRLDEALVAEAIAQLRALIA